MPGIQGKQVERLRIENENDKEKQNENFRQQVRESQNKLLQMAQITSSSGTRGPRSSKQSYTDDRSTPLLRGNVPENPLKMPSSSFICNMTFRNELPDPSEKIKILTTRKNRLDEICKYNPNNSLEKQWMPKLYIERDLGIPLDLLDMSVYNPPKGAKIPLDPEDEALLRSDDEEEGVAGGSHDGGVDGNRGDGNLITPKEMDGKRKKERPSDKHFPWLLKTQYITPLSKDPKKEPIEQARQVQKIHHQNDQANLDQVWRDKILSSFDASKREPVNNVNPELKPLRIRPFRPNLDRWDEKFRIADFDGSPTDSELYGHLTEDHATLKRKAIMKNYVASSSPRLASDKSEHLAYMAPSADELHKDIYEEKVSYSQIREYEYEVCKEDVEVYREDVKVPTTYIVTLGESEVQYVPIPKWLTLKKKRKGETSEGSTDCPVPEQMTMENKGSRRRRLKKKNIPNPNDDDHPKELEDDLSS